MAKVYFDDDRSSSVPYGTTVDIPSSMIDYEYGYVYSRAAMFIEKALKAQGIVLDSRTAVRLTFATTGDWLMYWSLLD